MRGIQVSSNEGPRPFPRANNYEIAKIRWQNTFYFIREIRAEGQFSSNKSLSNASTKSNFFLKIDELACISHKRKWEKFRFMLFVNQLYGTP